MKVWTLLVVALAGCAAALEPIPAPGCDLEVEFGPDVRDDGVRALARVNKATGCNVRERAGALFVDAVPVALRADGSPACATTTMTMDASATKLYSLDAIDVSTEVEGCGPVEYRIIHEVFHAMTAAGDDAHAESGAFSAVAGQGETINEASLTAVCSRMACKAFVPEVIAAPAR